jgi:hypothetical protein
MRIDGVYKLILTVGKKEKTAMSIDISLTIEEIVKKKSITYMEAILEYTNEVDGEIEVIAKMLNKSIKDKIELEAQELNMFKKSAKLPI